MARPPRLEVAGVPLHVIQRGVNRSACFFGDADRRFYLKCLAQASGKRGCAVHAYVLMTNHVHLLVTPQEKGAASAMLQDLGRKYVRVLNTLHGRTGTLWEGRYKSSLVDSETYLLACHRYIESNPVRAGMVREAASYPWSSHGHYAFGIANPMLTDHHVYRALGETQAERHAAFRALSLRDLDDKTIDVIRKATNAGVVLGSEAFVQRIANEAGRNVRLPVRGRPSKVDGADEAGGLPVSGKLL